MRYRKEYPMGSLQSAAKALPSAYKSIMFTGGPGTGKTTALLKLFLGKRKLVIDTDDKSVMAIQALPEPTRTQVLDCTDIWQLSNKRLSGSKEIGISRIPMYDQKKNIVPGTQGFVPPDPKGYKEFIDFINELSDISPFPYHLVGVDTLTIVGEHLSSMILNHHKLSAFTLQLFGVYKQNMLELVKGILSLPCHRVICVHETTRENDNEQQVVRPSIMGSYRDEIMKEFSEAYRFNGRSPTGKYTIRTAPNAMIQARTAMNLPAECEVEDMVKLYA